MPATLCLNMIVKNEAPIIGETLRAIVDHFPISTWVIHDTGSVDDTRNIICSFFASRSVPGKLVEREWEDFGANRQYALEDAGGLSDYVLFFDADDAIEGELPPFVPGYDAYFLKLKREGVVYPAKLIVRNDRRYRWRGVVHEGLYPTVAFKDHAESSSLVDGDYTIVSRRAGARSLGEGVYYRDAQKLANAFENIPPGDEDLLPRYAFYCANSWRDAGAHREAAEWYRRRIKLGGWADENYLAHLGLGLALEASDDQEGAIAAVMRGHEVCPDRAECLYHLARLHRVLQRQEMAIVFAEAGLRRSVPDPGRLFVWRDVYAYWLDFEFLLASKQLGKDIRNLSQYARMMQSGAPTHLKSMLS